LDDGTPIATKRYAIMTEVRPKMQGPDLVLQWFWKGNWKQSRKFSMWRSYHWKGKASGTLLLAKRVVNLTASFEVERVDLQR
jgi:hypothetical protein